MSTTSGPSRSPPRELSATPVLQEQTTAQLASATADNFPPVPSTSTSSAPVGHASGPNGVTSNNPPSFQDIDTDDSFSSDEEDREDAKRAFAAAENIFTVDEIDKMVDYLKERGLFAFVTRYVQEEMIPIPTLLLAFGVMIPPGLGTLQDHLRLLKITCSKVLRHRDKLEQYNTVEDAISLIRSSKRIMILTGAGVSTSCGIPDFRSPTGLYARLKEEHWELEDPQEMFDLAYFKEKPNVFYSFAKEIYPSNFTPSPCHRFVKVLEMNQKLLRNYTQNIDGLFELVGVQNMLNCHGSFATASCLRCRTTFPGSSIEADVFASRVPLCRICTEADHQAVKFKPVKKAKMKWKDGESSDEDSDGDGTKGEWEGKPLVKPDIVFFGEMLSDEFDHKLLEDREKVDLLIVIGTSLRVSPVAQIVSHLPHSVPQILINRDPITHANFDIHLLGDGDTIVEYLTTRLGDSFNLSRVPVATKHDGEGKGKERAEERGHQGAQKKPVVVPERVGNSHVWLFPGANEGRWVEAVRQAYGGGEEGSDESEIAGEHLGAIDKVAQTEAASDDEEEEWKGISDAALLGVTSAEGTGSNSRTRSPTPSEAGENKRPRRD